MAVKTYYRGDDIHFLLTREDSLGNPVNLDTAYTDIIAYIYTSPSTMYKFSVTDKSAQGYYRITKNSVYEYLILVPSIVTKAMATGTGTIELNFIAAISNPNVSDNKDNSIKRKSNFFQLIDANIKAES